MAPAEDEEEESSDEIEGEELSRRDFVIFLARDIAIAVLVVGIIIGAIYAYARVWPPMVVVESGSMQHANAEGYLGVIDTGDYVVLEAVGSHNDVITYIEGRVSGYETYSNYGDVIVFHPPGTPADTTPIIHRPILFLESPSSTGSGVDIPALQNFPASEWRGTNASGSTSNPSGLVSVTVQVRSWHLGYETRVNLTFSSLGLLRGSGFLTKGDHNSDFDRAYDSGGRPPVPVPEIIGKARGELPWFGLIKLTIWPTVGCCRRGWGDPTAPRNSWDSLATSLVLLPVGIFLADYGFAFLERLWKARKERKKESAGDAGPKEPPPGDSETKSSDAPR